MSFCLHCRDFDLGSELLQWLNKCGKWYKIYTCGKGLVCFKWSSHLCRPNPFRRYSERYSHMHNQLPIKWTIENIVIKTAIAHHVFKGRSACIVGVLGRFQQRVCPIAITVHILMFSGWFYPARQYDWKQCGKRRHCSSCFQQHLY